MAGAPASTPQTHQPFLDVSLNLALVQFASKYMKQKLELLAHECDRRLERELLPKLLVILREIDGERDAFEKLQRDATHELRDQLNLLRCSASVVDDAVDQLHTVVPRYLSFLPTASSLAMPGSDLATLSAPGTSIPKSGASSTPDSDADGQAAGSSMVTLGTPSSHHTGTPIRSITQAKVRLSNTKPQRLDSIAPDSPTSASKTSSSSRPQDLTTQTQIRPPAISPNPDSQVLDEVITITKSSVVSRNPKRPNIDCSDDSDTLCKRQKTTNEEDTSGVVESRTTRRIAFPNLMTNECIFRHAERKGFFVIRCSYCEPGIFTDPPLMDNRALTHFQKHSEAITGHEELTNESIFEKFSCRVDGDEMASKYWIREHLGAMPHTFVPMRSVQHSSYAGGTEIVARKPQETNPSSPFRKLRDSLRGRQVDLEKEPETSRRTLRNLPRPDYAEMVANKDPWNVPDVETERTATSVNVVRSSSSTKRRLTKPGIGTTAETAELKKPFGYMSEPWPRRSAPR